MISEDRKRGNGRHRFICDGPPPVEDAPSEGFIGSSIANLSVSLRCRVFELSLETERVSVCVCARWYFSKALSDMLSRLLSLSLPRHHRFPLCSRASEHSLRRRNSLSLFLAICICPPICCVINQKRPPRKIRSLLCGSDKSYCKNGPRACTNNIAVKTPTKHVPLSRQTSLLQAIITTQIIAKFVYEWIQENSSNFVRRNFDFFFRISQ